MFGLSKRIRKVLFLAGISFSLNAFAVDVAALADKFKAWENQYLILGIYPTDLEVLAEGKKLELVDSQISFLLDYLHSNDAAELVSSYNALRTVYSKSAIKGQNSKSTVTANIANRVLSLLEDVNAEKKSRNITKFKVTNKKLNELFSLLAKRIDAETDAEKITEMIGNMDDKHAPFESERTEFIKDIDLFYVKESSEHFDAAAFMKDLGEKFNEHINKVNAELLSR